MKPRLKTGIALSLLAAFATALLATPAAAADRAWEFEVSLDDRKIGYHRFNVSDDGSRQVLETEAAFDVKLLFITAFRYRHSNVEVWDDGCLESIDARKQTLQIGAGFQLTRANALGRVVQTDSVHFSHGCSFL